MQGTCIIIIQTQKAKICNNCKNTRSVMIYKLIVIVLLLVILQNNKNARYMYYNNTDPKGKNLQQLQKHQERDDL